MPLIGRTAFHHWSSAVAGTTNYNHRRDAKEFPSAGGQVGSTRSRLAYA